MLVSILPLHSVVVVKVIRTSCLSITLLLTLGIVSCGANVKSKSVKEYRVTLAKGDSSFVPLIKTLVSDYNANAGLQALQYVDSADQANSRIVITEGLEKRDGKVGWGQWLTSSQRSGSNIPGGSIDETTEYSLQVEFDADFLRSNSKIDDGAVQYEAQKLFAHEIGHGFQMDHDPDVSNVMYLDITGIKDFKSYFSRVRSFFSTPD